MSESKRELILKSAFSVFKKYGYQRVSMNEVAEGAGISRPGLYLYFKSKEDIFNAAILYRCRSKADVIKAGLTKPKTLEDRLMYAFEIWTIDHFDEVLKSQEAKDMSDSARHFARDALNEGYEMLADIVCEILKAHFKKEKTRKVLPAEKTARLIISSLRGFKLVASSATELRKMMSDLLKLTLS